MQAQCSVPVEEWINTEEYKNKNFDRKSLVINPAKACQPLGAVLAGCGFEGCLTFVHGSQGCAAYYRNNISRHFREPFALVSDSMTEDAAVFGGMANLVEGLRNAYALYKPKMIAICTSCMSEVIGDDLTAFIQNARKKEAIPEELPVIYANTPSFVGSHITGYDRMLKSILEYLTAGKKEEAKSERINIIPGFDGRTGNIRELKRILDLFGVEYTILADTEMVLDSPLNGAYQLYPGGTSLEEAGESINNKATISLQKYTTPQTMRYIKDVFQQETVALTMPVSMVETDRLLMEISRITGKAIPEELEVERGRAVDAITDAHQYFHGKRFALFGDPDIVLGTVKFLLEMGGIPAHILCTNGSKKFGKEVEAVLQASPFGKDGKVYIGKDLWHLRSLLVTEPVDMLLGSSHGKFAARDAGIPLVRIAYPIIDRVNMHRYPTIGYQGIINMVSWIANAFLEKLDRESDDAHFELMR